MNRNLYIDKLKQAAGCVFFTQRRDDTNNIDKIMIMRVFFHAGDDITSITLRTRLGLTS